MKRLSILGATGSIGRNTLEIVRRFPRRFSVAALTARNNVELLARQVEEFSPEIAVVYDASTARKLESLLPANTRTAVLFGEDGYCAAAVHDAADMVVSAMVGAAGMIPTLAAVNAKKHVALANKETLVMAGDIVMRTARENGVSLLPVDSEHSAIFQCIGENRRQDLSKLLLTASGGPFRNLAADAFSSITPGDALNHPTWQMGAKITIDSATLMNKGLEVIEARHLFDVPADRIEVVVHPQSIVHSMVSFADGSVMAQMGMPDMKGAIAYALSFPERLPLNLPVPDFAQIGSLNFEAPDFEKFPCLGLAYDACAAGGTLPAVLNAANEIAVAAFLQEKIKFSRIPAVLEHAMGKHILNSSPDIDAIIDADHWARAIAAEWIGKQ